MSYINDPTRKQVRHLALAYDLLESPPTDADREHFITYKEGDSKSQVEKGKIVPRENLHEEMEKMRVAQPTQQHMEHVKDWHLHKAREMERTKDVYKKGGKDVSE